MSATAVDTRLQYVEKQILGLEKDVDANSRLSSKFDLTLDKIGEATASIKEMLAVHDNVLRRQYDTDLDLYRVIDEHRKDDMQCHKEMLEANEKSIREVCSKIDKHEADVVAKLVVVSTSSLEHDKRIRGLERITYIGLGLAVLAGIIIDKIPFDSLF